MTLPNIDVVAEAMRVADRRDCLVRWSVNGTVIDWEGLAAAAVEALQVKEERLNYIGGGSVARLVGPYRYVRREQP